MNMSDLETFLNDLATKLTPGAQHVYELAVRNQIITGAIGLASGIFLALVAVTLITAVLFRAVRTKGYSWIGDDTPSAALIGGIFGGALLVIGILLIATSLPILLNPEWYAIKDLLSQIPGSK
jgi:hypothetical protein